MKKILAAILFIILCQAGTSFTPVLAETDNPVLEATIEKVWVNMEQAERDAKINYYRDKLFSDGKAASMSKKDFRAIYKDKLKDSRHRINYRLISAGINETAEYNLSGFFTDFNDAKVLYAYATQAKKDLKHIYYYNAMGKLSYIDDIIGDYPNFPYVSKQYRSNGKLAGVILFENHDLQYVYEPDGHFKGLWYKDKMYNRKGNVILTRSNW